MTKWMRGSLTVEASLVFPVVLIVMLPFLFLLKVVYVHAYIQTAIFDTAESMEGILYLSGIVTEEVEEKGEEASEEVKKRAQEYGNLFSWLEAKTDLSAAEAVLSDLGLQSLSYAMLEQTLDMEMLEDWGVSGKITLLQSDFDQSDGERSELFVLTASYKIPFPFTWKLLKMGSLQASSTGRAYTGQSYQGSADSDSGNSEVVYYYRIGNGTHYHTKDCYLIKNEKHSMTKQQAVAAGYRSCGQCSSRTGNIVYTTTGGECYHAKGCTILNPVITKITQEQAEAAGYQPCEICIGGGTWFG